MKIWAISDLHLSFGVPNKQMDLFGPAWKDHHERIQSHWDTMISQEDLVLIPGDISWAMRLDEALPDLKWIHERPGKKVLLKGNHDYWWGSLKKMQPVLPDSISLLHNNTLLFGTVSVSGTRLWDSNEYSFGESIEYVSTGHIPKEKEPQDAEAIFLRELHRLELSLQEIPPTATVRIGMTHYPPIGLDLQPSRASRLFEKYGVSVVVFGHLHSLKKTERPLFGEARGVRYILTSADWIDFVPVEIAIDT